MTQPLDLNGSAVLVLGTRPEIIKFYSIIEACSVRGLPTCMIHTGQHYDFEMSAIFFRELDLPEPDLFLEIGSGTHGRQTAEMLRRLEEILSGSHPRFVIAEGDTNSVLAAALAAAKLTIPFVHLEAGVRSFDMTMPEEVNRRLADSIATVCLAPTPRALANLRHEGRGEQAYLAGDTLVEVCQPLAERARQRREVLEQLGVVPGGYAVLTLHRSENVDDRERLADIVAALEGMDFPVVCPLHPRTKKMLQAFDLFERVAQHVIICPPQGYLEFMALSAQARLILTDSGGLQQEAAILNVPCLTLRFNTEWIETVEAGKNRLVGAGTGRILETARTVWNDERVNQAMRGGKSPFVPGAARRILDLLWGEGSESRLSIARANFLRDGVPE